MADSSIEINSPIARYYGQDITCYPSSNAKDEGKLNLEFNMARFVTRVTSKNFCIVKPSYELTLVTDSTTGVQYIKVGTGQCSINGMDLIMTNTINIDAPEEPGSYYIVFKLARDGSENVEGDQVVGVTKTFFGVRLQYFTEKPDPLNDPDVLYLGHFDFDGTSITNLEEDEDKYGRIWAEDVLAKIFDPKHPDITRLNLQELTYNLPDWYFSKEGDTVYGPIILADNRTKNNPGIILNVDEQGSHITIKDPKVDNDKLLRYGDVNQDGVIDSSDIQIVQDFIDGKITLTDLQQILGDVNHDGIVDEKDIQFIQNFLEGKGKNCGDTNNIYYIQNTDKGVNIDVSNGQSGVEIGKATIYENEADDILHIDNKGATHINTEGEFQLEADTKIDLHTEGAVATHLTLDDSNMTVSKPDTELKFNIGFPSTDTLQQTVGKAIWEYDNTTKNIKLLQRDVNYLDIVPNGIFEQKLTVQDTIFIGPLNNQQTFLKQTKWQMSDGANKSIVWTPSSMVMTNESLSNTDNSYILLKNGGNSIHTQIYDNGKIELLNGSTNPTINWKDGNTTFDVTLEKIIGEKRLNLQGNLSITNNITAGGLITGNGLKTTNGQITFSKGTNDATITKDNNSTTLRTNGDLYVGTSGASNLYAGNTVINGTFGVGGDSYTNCELKIDTSGNINTSGTITGSKIYNAVYNDYAEVFKKDKNEVIEPGDIVCLKSDGLVHKVTCGDDVNTIIGICSDTEGVLLGGKDIPEEEQVIVGLVGQLWVKTNSNYIQPGQMVKVLPDGTIDITQYRQERFGVTLSNVINGKVKIIYNG